MRVAAVNGVLAALAAMLTVGAPAYAQDPPPRIPLVVADVHGNVAKFNADPLLASSRGLDPSEMPGIGPGGDVALHVYPFRWRAITFGVGGQLTLSRAH